MKKINTNDIFVTDFSNISMTTDLLQLKTPKGEIALDIHKLLNQDINSSDAYFNATQIAKLFGKKYDNIIRSKNWSEYVTVIENILKSQICDFKQSPQFRAFEQNELNSKQPKFGYLEQIPKSRRSLQMHKYVHLGLNNTH